MAGPPPGAVVTVEEPLATLAAAYGVALSYLDWRDRRVAVAAETVVAVLGALGVDASSPAAVTHSLAEVRRAAARRALPATLVGTAGHPLELPVSGPLTLRAESGETRQLPGSTLPADLAVGWYDLTAGDAHATVLIRPERLELPAGLRRSWGWMIQLYSLPSAGSWAIGDYADLAALASWSASADGGGAGLLLCNPLHAFTPVQPIEDSPYFPSSRRFRSPLYLRLEDTAEYAAADPVLRRQVDLLRPPATVDRIDRDAIWAAKAAGLTALWPSARSQRLAEFLAEHGAPLADFATFCALAERHGRDWRQWPDELRDPAGPAVELARHDLSDRIAFHAWLQLLCDEQLATAGRAGLPVGVIHDLAVGVDPGGADAWAMQPVLAQGATVGCPPDAFNQLGQDWGLPPWHPTALAEAGYLPFRDLIRSVLRHAGGIRVDHVMGLFRLWWVPVGHTADRGTYMAYDAEAMLAALLIEAHRAGAVVVGEDLGTVEPRVAATLACAGVLGSDVAWFMRADDGSAMPPATWRAAALASVTTHDLPTVAGWLADEPVRVRAELGQLRGPVEDERARMAAERSSLLRLLREQRLLGAADPPDPADVMLALHRLLVAAPAALVVASPGDAVGDLRQPNLPGTRDEYPNWRLPLLDSGGRLVSLEHLQRDPSVRRLIDVFSPLRRSAPVIG